MSVLLDNSDIEVWRSSPPETDSHGWVVQGTLIEVGTYQGNVQEQEPTSDSTATDLGGAGPFQPAVQRSALGHLPLTADVAEGDMLRVDAAEWWLVTGVQRVRAPLSALPTLASLLVTLAWTEPVPSAFTPPEVEGS